MGRFHVSLVSLVTARVGIVLTLAMITASRVPIWTNDRALWGHAVDVTPQKPRALINFGNVLADDHDDVGAIVLYTRAILATADRRRPEWRRVMDRRIAVENRDRSHWMRTLRGGP